MLHIIFNLDDKKKLNSFKLLTNKFTIQTMAVFIPQFYMRDF